MSSINHAPPGWWLERMESFARTLQQPLLISGAKLQAEAPPEELSSLVCDDASARFEIYQNQYWMRIFVAVQHEFPALTALITPFGINQLVLDLWGGKPLNGPGLDAIVDAFGQSLHDALQVPSTPQPHVAESSQTRERCAERLRALPVSSRLVAQRLRFDESRRHVLRIPPAEVWADPPAMATLLSLKPVPAPGFTVVRLDPAHDLSRATPLHLVVYGRQGRVEVDEIDPLLARLLREATRCACLQDALRQTEDRCDERLKKVFLQNISGYIDSAIERGYWVNAS